MMNADRRHVPRHPQSAPDGSTDEQSTDQSRACSVGNSLDLASIDTCFFDDLFDQRKRLSNMVARGELWNHAAVFGMNLDLTVEAIGEQACLAIVNGNACFIARCFYT